MSVQEVLSSQVLPGTGAAGGGEGGRGKGNAFVQPHAASQLQPVSPRISSHVAPAGELLMIHVHVLLLKKLMLVVMHGVLHPPATAHSWVVPPPPHLPFAFSAQRLSLPSVA